MPGDLRQKFANLRLLLLTMWMHPGKKLLFMGGEFGQWSEWYCKRSLDWHLLEEGGFHSQMLNFVAELNMMYKAQPALWELDFSEEGFQWLDLQDRNNSIISFARSGKDRDNHLVAVFNYTPQSFSDYKVGLPQNCKYRKLFCSNSSRYGGSDSIDQEIYSPINSPYAQAPYHTSLSIPPLSGLILEPIRE